MRTLSAERNQTLYAANQLNHFIGVKSMRRPARTIMLLSTACMRVLRVSDFHLPFCRFQNIFSFNKRYRVRVSSEASVNRRQRTAHRYYWHHHHFLVAIAIEPMGADRSHGEDESMCQPLRESSAKLALILSGRVCTNKLIIQPIKYFICSDSSGVSGLARAHDDFSCLSIKPSCSGARRVHIRRFIRRFFHFFLFLCYCVFCWFFSAHPIRCV